MPYKYREIKKVKWKLHEVAGDMYVKKSKTTIKYWLHQYYWIKHYTSGGYVILDKKALLQIREVAWIARNFKMDTTGIIRMHKMKTLKKFLELHEYEESNYFV